MDSNGSHADGLEKVFPKAPTSRRYTTMEGWRDARTSVHAAAGIGLWLLAPSPQFNPEVFLDEDTSIRTRASVHRRDSNLSADSRSLSRIQKSTREGRNSIQQSIPENPFDDSQAFPPSQSPFDDTTYAVQDSDSDNQQPALPPPTQTPSPTPPEEPYHLFDKRKKWFLVVTISMAGLFSGLSSNIYFPSLDAIAKDLNVSLQDVNLTITSYLIIQGISPLIWGSLSDALGRRPIYIASFTVYIIANIALSFSPNFAILLLFRGLQAAGSASTVSIGNGVIQDVSPPSERGAFISFYQAIRNFSIAIGPVLGGILSNFLGFRSIFVFLLILSGLVLADIVVFLPETMRSITGNGSVRAGGIYKPLIYLIKGEPSYTEEPAEPIIRKKITARTFLEPLQLLIQKDILLNLIFGGVIYTIWSMVTSSTTSLFKETFNLSELTLGLAFLPNGIGTIVGSAIVGNLMTKDYKKTEAQYRAKNNLPDDFKLSPKSIPVDFPIEKARLGHLPWIAGIFLVSTGVYGFLFAFPAVVSMKGWIAVPLIMQFFIAATSNAVFAVNQTLVSDLCPGKGASATAINNLVRCGLGAIGVALIEGMISSWGPGVAFLSLALLVIMVAPLAAANLLWGMQWRVERTEKKLKKENEKSASFMNV
ncbi:hypothetical protein N0V93_003169 [Gnomoniopsis smithogilvyi]|uniref:Major facilitator superfamily (MFS) profile domain-containing protein n=1 Tax=Gnomoniopsis smithogilvyi TaxID=1191159 RepID=A0A9W8YZX6_9PEZI|nr:hypothetical protein N0V93_003169 [Gnomoniopsis smithogilvyi]